MMALISINSFSGSAGFYPANLKNILLEQIK